jgi:hypothetical protein
MRQEEEAQVAASPVEVRLTLEPGDPIEGRAFRGEHLVGSFAGWMELYAAIEKARRPEQPVPSEA